MLQSMPVIAKLTLMVLVVVQSSWHKAHVDASAVAGIYAAALCVLVACCLPAAVFSVMDREQTSTFLLQTAAQMLATAYGMHYLLQSGDPGHAVVWLQSTLAHIFYGVSLTALEHRKRHILPNRQSVRVVSLGCVAVFPLVLSLRCAAHQVDLPVALMVMFSADIMHVAVAIATMLALSVARLYEQCFSAE